MYNILVLNLLLWKIKTSRNNYQYIYNEVKKFTPIQFCSHEDYCVVVKRAAVDSQSEQKRTKYFIGMVFFLGTWYPTLIYLNHAKFKTYTVHYRLFMMLML